MTAFFYLQVEAINPCSFVCDTNDNATIRSIGLARGYDRPIGVKSGNSSKRGDK